MRRAAVAVTVVLVLLVGVGAYVVSRLTNVHLPFLTDTCRVYSDEGVVRLNPDQVTHAATISAVAVRRQLPERAVTIALATALQESKLRNLSSGDRDSVGLFQQRPSQGWGTPAQLQEPRYAANAFYTHLVKVRGWQQMRLTDAAQAVQRSGTPQAFQQWENEASTLAKAFLGTETGAVTCRLRERTKLNGEDGVKKVVTELSHDLGKLSVSPRPAGEEPGLSVAVGGGSNSTLGWRTAHWFVAKSHEYGVREVQFNGKIWTADSGKWESGGKASSSQVEITIARES